MWLLKTSTGKLIYLRLNVSVSIGRKKGDILLPHDASISKLHASIIVKPHIEVMIGEPTSTCILKDEGSKYGTYISKNGTFEKVITDINLKDQDVIRIGLQKEIFSVTYIPIITMISAVQDNEKDKLVEIMDVIDGIITPDWNKYCTHLTVVRPKLTQKVAASLAAGIPIVSSDYWHAVKSVVEKGDPLPKTDDFVPEINEPYISRNITSLFPNYKRKTLFRDLIFTFFSSKQYEIYKVMVQLAGGRSVLFNPKTKRNSTLERNLIFINYSITDSTQCTEDFIEGYDYICKKLNACKCRIIPESEIPLAILYCSTEQYCNPNYNFGNFIKRQEKPNYNLPETLVVDTQDQDILIIKDYVVNPVSCDKKRINYVEETLESHHNSSIQGNALSQQSLDNPKKLTVQMGDTAFQNMFVPETIESSYDSQRNSDFHIQQSLSYDSFQRNMDNNLIEANLSINATFEEKHNVKLSDEYNNEQVGTLHVKEVFPSETQICIPETIDDNCSDFSENSDKICRPTDSFLIPNIFSKVNDSKDVFTNKQSRKTDKDVFIATQNVLMNEATKDAPSDEIQQKIKEEKIWITAASSKDIKNNSSTTGIQIRKNLPGKTFKKIGCDLYRRMLKYLKKGQDLRILQKKIEQVKIIESLSSSLT